MYLCLNAKKETSIVTANLINVMRTIKSLNDEKPEDFSDWHKEAGFVSMQRPDTFVAIQG